MMLTKQRIYLILIVWTIVFGVLIRFGLLPFFEAIKKNSEELTFQRGALQFFENRIKDFENYQKNYSLYEPIFKKINSSFVDPEVPIEFIKFLEKEAGKSGLSIRISPLTFASAGSDPGIPVGFQVSLEGSFSNCLRFVGRLEQSSFLVEIPRLNVQRIGKKTAEGLEIINISFLLDVKVFSKEIS